MAKIKISQLTAKGSSLANTDLLPIAEVSGLAYITKRVTGAQVGVGGSVTLTVGTTAIASGTIGRVFFQGTGNVLQQSANLFWDNTNGNLALGGTANSTDRLYVKATTTSAGDFAIRVQDSLAATNLFTINNAGSLVMRNRAFTGEFTLGFSANNTLNFGLTAIGTFMTVGPQNVVNFGAQTVQALLRGGQFASTVSGLGFGLNISGIPASSSGTVDVDALRINPTINNTGTYSGIVRGIYYNPTLASLVGTTHRAIETTTGNVIFNSTSGNVAIGGTSFGSSSVKVLAQYTGTAPSSSPTDAFQMYSADIVGGNAAPHFRTENGNIVKIYQETTGVASATFVQNAGTRVDEVSTFDGYTIAQVVKALRNLGILE